MYYSMNGKRNQHLYSAVLNPFCKNSQTCSTARKGCIAQSARRCLVDVESFYFFVRITAVHPSFRMVIPFCKQFIPSFFVAFANCHSSSKISSALQPLAISSIISPIVFSVCCLERDVYFKSFAIPCLIICWLK